MELLVLIHVLSAIIGVGPTFFGHVLFRRTQTLPELQHSMKVGKYLEYFPKIGGSIAVLTGIILVIIGDYGSFLRLWLIGSLVLYVLIQFIVILYITPINHKLAGWVFSPASEGVSSLPSEIQALLSRASNGFYLASGLGTLLFIFMIMKPGA